MSTNDHHEGASMFHENSLYKDSNSPPEQHKQQNLQIVWTNVVKFICLHLGAIYGLFLFLTQAMWATRLFSFALSCASGFGITAGVHRLWSHKAYKAKLPLKIILLIFDTIAIQNSVVVWVRDHRMHHKYSDTDADPHNAKRGFFFVHVGWLLVRKHPEITAKGHTIDMSDILADPLLRFQHKYYHFLTIAIGMLMPTYVPTLWGESWWIAFFVCGILRYVYTLNSTWLINSVGHMWGMKPYDKYIYPVDNTKLSIVTLGEGFHNYHHTFPSDYKASDLGDYSVNVTKLFIDLMAKIGWAYDLKTVTPDIIHNKIKKSGDGSHKI